MDVLLTTLEHLPGYEIEEVMGLVEVVEHRSPYFSVKYIDFPALYEVLKDKARQAGANAVLGVRFAIASAGAGGGAKAAFTGREWEKFRGGVIIYGTAVKLKNIQK